MSTNFFMLMGNTKLLVVLVLVLFSTYSKAAIIKNQHTSICEVRNNENNNENNNEKNNDVIPIPYNNCVTSKLFPLWPIASTPPPLSTLILTNCGIVELAEYKEMLDVHYIDLSYNQISGNQLDESVFSGRNGEPLVVENLNLAYNHISTLKEMFFKNMPDLKVLNLEGNHFQVLYKSTCEALSSIKKLEELNLANNRLSNIQDNTFRELRSLKKLDLSRNTVSFVHYAVNDAYILELILDNTSILEFKNISFKGVSNLQKLVARNLMHLKRIEAGSFNSTKNLTYIDLSGSSCIKDIDDRVFENNNIHQLFLNDMNLTSLPPNFANWEKLDVLQINGNNFTCSCDLFHISQKLNERVKRDGQKPTCYNHQSSTKSNIYELKEEICHKVYEKSSLLQVVFVFMGFLVLAVAMVLICKVLDKF